MPITHSTQVSNPNNPNDAVSSNAWNANHIGYAGGLDPGALINGAPFSVVDFPEYKIYVSGSTYYAHASPVRTDLADPSPGTDVGPLLNTALSNLAGGSGSRSGTSGGGEIRFEALGYYAGLNVGSQIQIPAGINLTLSGGGQKNTRIAANKSFSGSSMVQLLNTVRTSNLNIRNIGFTDNGYASQVLVDLNQQNIENTTQLTLWQSEVDAPNATLYAADLSGNEDAIIAESEFPVGRIRFCVYAGYGQILNTRWMGGDFCAQGMTIKGGALFTGYSGITMINSKNIVTYNDAGAPTGNGNPANFGTMGAEVNLESFYINNLGSYGTVSTTVASGTGTQNEAGQPTIAVASTSGFNVGDNVYVGTSSNGTDYSPGLVILSIGSGTITFTTNLATNQSNGNAVQQAPYSFFKNNSGYTYTVKCSGLSGFASSNNDIFSGNTPINLSLTDCTFAPRSVNVNLITPTLSGSTLKISNLVNAGTETINLPHGLTIPAGTIWDDLEMRI